MRMIQKSVAIMDKCKLLPIAFCVVLAVTSVEQTATAQISGEVVRIGVLTDYSGPFAALSGPGGVIAVRMAVEDFGGKVAGKSIEIIEADHGNKADTASAIARKWFDVDGVDMIADLPNSSIALAVQELARERKKLTITSASGTGALTGKACSPTGFQWTWDTYSIAVSTGKAVVQEGGKSWFIVAADYAFGHGMADDLGALVKANGGNIAGTVFHPLNTHDFSSFLLRAQSSGADVLALANGGTDTINSIKQASEFGLIGGRQKLVGLAIFITDVHAMGLDNAHGLLLTTGFYWDRTPATRAWSKRFFDRHHAMPTMAQAGIYSAVTNYLKAVEATGTDDAEIVAQRMRDTPVEDFFAEHGKLRADGRLVHDMYLAQVKEPQDSHEPWDYYNIVRTILGEESVRPLAQSDCLLVK
jgi:branched-chain amino acid transport system substrate-binding protein